VAAVCVGFARTAEPFAFETTNLCLRSQWHLAFARHCRDWRASVYELFSNAFTQTAETREYAQAMKLAPDGSFIIAKGGIQMSALGKHNGSVLRISPDGKFSGSAGLGIALALSWRASNDRPDYRQRSAGKLCAHDAPARDSRSPVFTAFSAICCRRRNIPRRLPSR